MTEEQWLRCTDPAPMLEYLRASKKGEERLLRHFVIGCCYQIWYLLPDEAKQLLEAVEQFAEGSATRHQRDSAVAAFRAVHGRPGADIPSLVAVYRCKNMLIDTFTADVVGKYTAAAVANAADAMVHSATHAVAYATGRAQQVSLLRCVFGNPFRPVAIHPTWRRWRDGAAVRIAQTIYDERRFQDLPILADALEEAGCTDPEILGHCREPGEHVRGCWVVDLILEKS